MANSPSFQFYPADFMTGAPATMDPDATHVYVWLLCLDWERTGFVFEEKILAKWCRLNVRRFRKAWATVSGCFEDRDGRLFNPRLEKERQKQEEWRVKSSLGGRASAAARQPHRTPDANGGATVVQPQGQPMANSSVISLQSSDPVITSTSKDDRYKQFADKVDRRQFDRFAGQRPLPRPFTEKSVRAFVDDLESDGIPFDFVLADVLWQLIQATEPVRSLRYFREGILTRWGEAQKRPATGQNGATKGKHLGPEPLGTILGRGAA